jgi:hypothetical protein
LTRQDLSVKTSVIASDVRGLRNKSLAWFWTMDIRKDADVGEWMEDCMCFLFCLHLNNNDNLLCSLSRALAEGKSSKDAVDRRNPVSPS